MGSTTFLNLSADVRGQFVGFVRDPWLRYLSGICQFIKTSGVLERWIPKRMFTWTRPEAQLACQLLFQEHVIKVRLPSIPNSELVVFDEHTTPISVYIEPFNDCHLYPFDQFDGVVKAWMRIDPTTKLCRLNKGPHRTKGLIEETLKGYDNWVALWSQVFADDIRLYNELCST